MNADPDNRRLRELLFADQPRRPWDPIPHLAALIDGLRQLAAQDARDPDFGSLASLLTGPYAALRGGLLLDEPGREGITTEAALREVLNGRTGEQEERS